MPVTLKVEMKFHERVKLIAQYHQMSWADALESYSKWLRGAENPWGPQYKPPPEWRVSFLSREALKEKAAEKRRLRREMSASPVKVQAIARKRAEEAVDMAVTVKAYGVEAEIDHLKMAQWFVRKCGSVEAAFAALVVVRGGSGVVEDSAPGTLPMVQL